MPPEQKLPNGSFCSQATPLLDPALPLPRPHNGLVPSLPARPARPAQSGIRRGQEWSIWGDPKVSRPKFLPCESHRE